MEGSPPGPEHTPGPDVVHGAEELSQQFRYDASPRLEDKLPEGYRCGAVEEDMLKVNGLAAGCTSMLADAVSNRYRIGCHHV